MRRRLGREALQRKVERLRARIARNPSNARLFQGLGRSHVELAIIEKAVPCNDAEAAFRRAVALAPADPWNHLYLGTVFYEGGQYRKSCFAFEYAHSLAPKLGLALVFMGDAYAGSRDYARADRCYRKAVEVEPDCDVARRRLTRWLSFWEPERQRRESMRGICRGCGYYLGDAPGASCPACEAANPAGSVPSRDVGRRQPITGHRISGARRPRPKGW